jgi:hypothetical protein
MSINFWRVSGAELAQPSSELLPAVLWMYRLSCISLNCLNAMWFWKMAKGAAKVLMGPKGSASAVRGDSCIALKTSERPAPADKVAGKAS